MKQQILTAALNLNRAMNKVNKMSYKEAADLERGWGRSLDDLKKWEQELTKLSELIETTPSKKVMEVEPLTITDLRPDKNEE